MRPEEMTQLLRKRPFTPLRIHLTDGTTYEIHHPEQVLVLRQRLDIGVLPDPTTGVLEAVDSCSLLHVVRVEQLHGSSV